MALSDTNAQWALLGAHTADMTAVTIHAVHCVGLGSVVLLMTVLTCVLLLVHNVGVRQCDFLRHIKKLHEDPQLDSCKNRHKQVCAGRNTTAHVCSRRTPVLCSTHVTSCKATSRAPECSGSTRRTFVFHANVVINLTLVPNSTLSAHSTPSMRE